MKVRKQPVRTCVSCRTTDEKRDLLRVVRQPDGTVCYDPKGKINGRGAYVCPANECITQAQRQKRLERSLRASTVSADVFEALLAVAAASGVTDLVPPMQMNAVVPQQRITDKENKV